jgi:hypothetical protein
MQRLALFQLGNKVNRAFALIRKASRPENAMACIDRDYRNNVVLMDRRFLSDLRSDEKKTDSDRNTTNKQNARASAKEDSNNPSKATEVLYKEMLKDGFKPTFWLYKTLMHQLAKKGYTHMVFTLFKQVTLRYDRFIIFS